MKVLAFGEILWDINGEVRNIGGAPLNVAGHIVRLGGEAVVVSALGADSLGDESRNELRALGISDSHVSTSKYPTGYAEIYLKDGIPSYRFNSPAAWDDITLTEAQLEDLSAGGFDAIVYGTLALRNETSRETLFRLLDRVEVKERFFDVNLRLNFYSLELIRRGLERATILKMNEDELPVVAAAIGVDCADAVDALFDHYSALDKVLLTLGGDGSECHERGRVYECGCGDGPVVSTVGAGDSLSAAFLHFSHLGYDSGKALSRAAILADYVVGKEAAIPEYDEVVNSLLM